MESRGLSEGVVGACEGAGAGAGECVCRERSTAPTSSLAVLQDVHRAYESRLEAIEKRGGKQKLERQVEVLRAWVGDLVGQNTLLARAVEELEREATERLLIERKRHAEMELELRAEVSALRRRLTRKDSDLRGLVEVLRRLREFDYCTLEGIHFFETERRKRSNCDLKQLRSANDSLQKENLSKEREIRRLNVDLQKYEQTIVNLRSETMCNRRSQSSQKRDAEVMVGMCCGRNEPAADNVRALRRVNVALSEELHALRRVCAALDEQCRAVAVKTTFKDEIIREMRRQLKQAKAKLKELENPPPKRPSTDLKLQSDVSFSSLPVAVRTTQPRRASQRSVAAEEAVRPSHDSDDCRSPRRGASSHRRYSRNASRYTAKSCPGCRDNLFPKVEIRDCEGVSISSNVCCPPAPTGITCGSIEELERQFLDKYEPCTSHRECINTCPESCDRIGTTCPVGDTDPSKRYRITAKERHEPACPTQADQPTCATLEEPCDRPSCPAQKFSPRGRTPRSCSDYPAELTLPAGSDGVGVSSLSSYLKSPRSGKQDGGPKSPRQSPREKDSAGRSQGSTPRGHTAVPGLALGDSSDERSNNKDSARGSALKKSSPESPNRNLRPNSGSKHKTYQHESATDDERDGDRSRAGSPKGTSSNRGTPRAGSKPGSSRNGTQRKSGKGGRRDKSNSSPSDSKKSSARSSPSTSRKSASSRKSSKSRSKKKKSKRKSGSRSTSELEDNEASLGVDISPRNQVQCFNPECPNRPFERDPSPPKVSCRVTPVLKQQCGICPEMARPCPCNRSATPRSERSSPRRSTVSPREEKTRDQVNCYNTECPNRSPRRSPRRREEDVDRCRGPCLARGPVVPVYDRPPCTSYMVPPSVTTTLKDIVNKITFGLASGTPQVGPIQAVTGPCLGPPEDPESRRCVRFCDASTTCSENVEELFFNRDLRKSDNSVECMCPQSSHKAARPTSDDKMERTCTKINNESGAGSSVSCSGGSAGGTEGVGGIGGVSCDAARAQYYHNKLLATLQILQNKEETCRVQSESLAVAESRIATLNLRAERMRAELDQKTKEISKLRDTLDRTRDVCDKEELATQTQEVERQKSVVKTLQTNLCVIEDLYRECFYETARQEQMIEALRKSCLDVRLIEKEKSEEIGKLHNVINKQTWSVERCQDIAAEVENLKLEIHNFLNSSNNDSGVWERDDSLATEVGEDLHDIMNQLRLLRDTLAEDCSCKLREENEKLKEIVGSMESQIGDYHRRVCAVECALKNKDDIIKKYKKLLEEKEEELENARQEIAALKEKERDQIASYESLTEDLEKTQGVLQERSSELAYAQRKCGEHETTIDELRQELEKADRIIKENAKVRSEVSYLTQQVSLWRRQLMDSEARVRTVEAELARARARANDLDSCYREKVECASALQEQLEDAHARGAQLCAEARRVVSGVRHWVRNMKQQQREQEAKISEQASHIAALEEALRQQKREGRNSPSTPAESTFAPVRMLAQAGRLLADQLLAPAAAPAHDSPDCRVCDACVDTEHTNTDNTDRTSKGICRCRKRSIVLDADRPSSSHAHTRTATPTAQRTRTAQYVHTDSNAHTRRVLRKRMCDNMRCSVRVRSAVDRPLRMRDDDDERDQPQAQLCCSTFRQTNSGRDRRELPISPTADLISRVERLQEAISDGQRRWKAKGCNTTRE